MDKHKVLYGINVANVTTKPELYDFARELVLNWFPEDTIQPDIIHLNDGCIGFWFNDWSNKEVTITLTKLRQINVSISERGWVQRNYTLGYPVADSAKCYEREIFALISEQKTVNQKKVNELLNRIALKMNTTKTEVIKKGVRLMDLLVLEAEKGKRNDSNQP